MSDIAKKLRDMHALAAGSCDPEFSWALLQAAAEIERLRAGLAAAIRAANLALFVIRKQGVMPNSSWEAGFAKDLATAEAAKAGNEQRTPEQDAALQELVDQAQELDMGYGQTRDDRAR